MTPTYRNGLWIRLSELEIGVVTKPRSLDFQFPALSTRVNRLIDYICSPEVGGLVNVIHSHCTQTVLK